MIPHSLLARSSISFLVLEEIDAFDGAFLTSATGSGAGAGAGADALALDSLLSPLKNDFQITNHAIATTITIPMIEFSMVILLSIVYRLNFVMHYKVHYPLQDGLSLQGLLFYNL